MYHTPEEVLLWIAVLHTVWIYMYVHLFRTTLSVLSRNWKEPISFFQNLLQEYFICYAHIFKLICMHIFKFAFINNQRNHHLLKCTSLAAFFCKFIYAKNSVSPQLSVAIWNQKLVTNLLLLVHLVKIYWRTGRNQDTEQCNIFFIFSQAHVRYDFGFL